MKYVASHPCKQPGRIAGLEAPCYQSLEPTLRPYTAALGGLRCADLSMGYVAVP